MFRHLKWLQLATHFESLPHLAVSRRIAGRFPVAKPIPSGPGVTITALDCSTANTCALLLDGGSSRLRQIAFAARCARRLRLRYCHPPYRLRVCLSLILDAMLSGSQKRKARAVSVRASPFVLTFQVTAHSILHIGPV